ncbi:hypothetical protein O6H91_02G020300 [Diphasiastrum complanatum]|uniref:Uncharacterized protein n=1 Tax=Diphasiastrum complanatum TaxID=34168 RepID=A0ACC2ED64_DIPCM|nr:hypothetical protein O6H91_02G020300 [Diphasiastrum complanatum]
MINREECVDEKEVRVWSWGAGTYGQLAVGSVHDALLPQPVPTLGHHGVSLIACGGAHAAAITDKCDVVTWGRGSGGALGHGDIATIPFPKIVHSLQGKKIRYVAAGWNHTAFIAENGKIFTCGDGAFGQLGHGDLKSCSTPRMIIELSLQTVSFVACGMRHTLALVIGGETSTVFSFGSSKCGQLGIAPSTTNVTALQPLAKKSQKECIPKQIHKLIKDNVSCIAANGDHSAAITDSGSLYLWGKGYAGDPDIFLPSLVAGNLSFCQVALSWSQGLGLSRDGELLTWGSSKCSQSGLESRIQGAVSYDPSLTNPDFTYPEENQTRGNSEEQSLNLSCLKKNDISLDDRYSVNAQSNSARPRIWRVQGLEGIKVVQIAAGAEHFALVSDFGAVMTWGWGEHGQLGFGTDNDQGFPHEVCFDGSPNHAKSACSIRVCCGSGFMFTIKEYHIHRCLRLEGI